MPRNAAVLGCTLFCWLAVSGAACKRRPSEREVENILRAKLPGKDILAKATAGSRIYAVVRARSAPSAPGQPNPDDPIALACIDPPDGCRWSFPLGKIGIYHVSHHYELPTDADGGVVAAEMFREEVTEIRGALIFRLRRFLPNGNLLWDQSGTGAIGQLRLSDDGTVSGLFSGDFQLGDCRGTNRGRFSLAFDAKGHLVRCDVTGAEPGDPIIVPAG